ncbi:phosphotransferase enzyme family protein [Zopfia rhizophila CBS 207.26]|uniref:Phosphotransferase enzyme family protein n=1 Tax=Zopfia rhizophila CBS 207.26 TaxID=1314779 RepID=A0A6A6DG62_9PEZI|nr:phosphotransferase enzyme family protein [Zopfia rhizophila CBS 207.26]
MNIYTQFSPADLPDGSKSQMTFFDSSYFRTHNATRPLPSPAEVRARSILSDPQPSYDPKPVKFEELDLIVKFGPRISTSEALCLWAVRKFLPNQVPVPEVYGWDNDGRHVFIYMQLIRGPSLLERYDSLNHHDKQAVCQDLRMIMSRLRAMRQSSISHGPIRDRILDGQPTPGPFPNIASFHNWFSWLWRRHSPEPENIPDPWRKLLADDGPIVFTHADLHRNNIIITPTSPPRVLAIIDWEQAGWYPDYWEYCKAVYSVGDWEDWRANGWIDSFLTPQPLLIEAWNFYKGAIGGF